LIGDGAVGKTNLIVSYIQDRFIPEYQPTVFDKFNGKLIFLQIFFFVAFSSIIPHWDRNELVFEMRISDFSNIIEA
jgi:hypothetical protein